MTLFIYLYFIHFLADYTFQWTALVRYKSRHFLGIVLHSSIHLAAHLVILAPFLHDKKVLTAIVGIYIAHIIVDQSKLELNKKADPKQLRLFYFTDQAIHCAIITVAAWYVGKTEPRLLSGWVLEIYTEPGFALYLLSLTLVTHFFDVSRYFYRLRMNKEEYKRDYKTMLINAGIVTVAFGIYWMAY